jgi:hypothetical protein
MVPLVEDAIRQTPNGRRTLRGEATAYPPGNAIRANGLGSMLPCPGHRFQRIAPLPLGCLKMCRIHSAVIAACAALCRSRCIPAEPTPSKDALQRLDVAYVARAEKGVAPQLSRAGVRLAAVLNKALGKQVAEP